MASDPVTPAERGVKQLFLVELWREPSAGGTAGPWRGIVRYVAHAQERYVVRLDDVTAFIARCIDSADPP